MSQSVLVSAVQTIATTGSICKPIIARARARANQWQKAQQANGLLFSLLKQHRGNEPIKHTRKYDGDDDLFS